MQYQAKIPRRKRTKLFIVAGMGISIALTTFGAWWFFDKYNSQPTTTINTAIQPETENIPVKKVTARYLFSGTVVLARAVENEARTASGVNWNQPFSKFDTFNPGQYDGWVADMECPVTTQNISYSQQVAHTIFNCRPEFLKPMSKYFTVLNLANNHTYDMGKERFAETQQHILEAGIQTLGNQDPAVKKDVCEVMAMNVKVHYTNGVTKPGVLPIAMCAWHYFEREPLPGEFDVMHEYAAIMPVIGLMQVGVEYVARADARQEMVAREIIDRGAEFVIGNSPHWVQNSAVYKGKLIFYSTGNFIFDQLDRETNRGASVQVDMTIDYDENVAKWLALGKSCTQHKDQCLEKAQQQGLKKIQPAFKYALVASTTGYKQLTQKASPSVQQAVEERANWAQTLKQLGQ